MLLYPIGNTQACGHACHILKKHGYSMTDHPCPEITHLVLDVPSFQSDGLLRGGADLSKVLSMVPPTVCIIGGNLDNPCLHSYSKMDLLLDPGYLAKNAEITADCALRLAAGKLDRTFSDTPALVIGWGRIGKCLIQKLKAAGCPVASAARNIHDRAMLEALGIPAFSIEEISHNSAGFHLIFNTVPARLPLLHLSQNCLVWDLASCSGLSDTQAVPARGLPGSMAPYSSGKLIAQTIINHFKEEKL